MTMLSIKTEAATLELIEAELKKSPLLENIEALIENFKDVKFMYGQLYKLNIYCSLNPHDNAAKERLLKVFDELDKELAKLAWKVLYKNAPHPILNT